ncbi:hypothetical protein GOBAR_AA33950 [Gossypium barbadense]|uniref:Uncharacterized protein n=1 Tax=Gossypium barbadense TaxID=3634 RepID=A0A2P5W6N2_GOSBA|nr:hypothetical protein GOBAR_AA33950 [Gossypium barbadense]
MPNSAKFLKELLANKRKFDATSHMELNAVCSAILKNKLKKVRCYIAYGTQCSDDAVTLQARDSVKTSTTQDTAMKLVDDKTNIQSSLQEPFQTKIKETSHYYQVVNKDTHEKRRLQIEDLDEWRAYKPRTYDKPNLCQNKPDTSPNQLKVSDKVLLDAVDPHIVTTTPNEEIPLTVLIIFPFSTVEVSHPKFGTFKAWGYNTWAWEKRMKLDTVVRHGRVNQHARGTRAKIGAHGHVPWLPSMSSSRGKKTAVPASKKRNGASSSAGPTVKIPGHCINWAAVEQVQMADAIRALLTTDPWELFFGIIELTYLELTMELCSTFHLQTVMTRYDDPGMVQFRLGGLIRQLSVPEFGAALGLYTEEEAREHWCRQHPRRLLLMVHVVRARHRSSLFHSPRDLAPDGAVSEGGHLHWPLRDSASATLQAPQHRSPRIIPHPYLPDYCLAQSTKEEAYEDIPDDVPPQHEDPPAQSPPPSRLVHAAASYADISECLTRFKHQCFQ